MEQHDADITITKAGEVKVHVKGAKGKACLNYTQFIADLVGKVRDQSLTSEYYEPDSTVRLQLHQKVTEGNSSAS